MEGKSFEHIGVNFILLILFISGGIRLVLTETKSLERDYFTRPIGDNIEIACRSEAINSTDPPSWFKYDHGKILIYNASSSSNVDPNKYTVGTGNKTLTVMNAEWSDAVTYCCNVGGLDDYCANVVIANRAEASVKPSSLVRVGDNVTIVCSFSYNAPTMDLDAPFPLSEYHDPKVSMFIGSYDIFEEPVVDVATVPHTKSISINKTIEVADLDRYLGCSGPLLGQLIDVVPIDIVLKYPNNESSPRSVYSINEAFECLSERFPFLNVTWTNMTRTANPHIISRGIGNATAKVLTPGYNFWVCSVESPLNRQRKTYLSFRGSAGVISRPIPLMAGCMLLIAFIIF